MEQANEILVGLQVDNEELYAKYRAEMTPLLEAHGGCFVVDVRVAAVLRAPGEGSFNRLFTIRFPTSLELDAFFSNPDYLAIRRRWFEPSVSSVTRLGNFRS